MSNIFKQAFETNNIESFINLMFTDSWAPLGARILESGAEFTDKCLWAPRWSKIPLAIRKGKDEFETSIKSCIFRVHDCLHQLWGLPIPSDKLTIDDKYLFKRAAMCGEVAVLSITEFAFCSHLYDKYPDTQKLIWSRNAIPLWRLGPLQDKSLLEVTVRLDGLLHKKIRPKWVRDSDIATIFVDDYVPMLERDRTDYDNHWESMKRNNWIPITAPNSRYSSNLDGLELTMWMIEDFLHLMKTDSKVDWALREFNKNRRREIVIPSDWDKTTI